MIIGGQGGLQFDLWLGEHEKSLAQGSLRAFVGRFPIWSDEERRRGISWTWIDLLEQLGRSWPFLKYEESVPLSVGDWRSLLRDGRGPEADYDFEPGWPTHSREAYVFVRRHNLATGLEGIYLPSLSLLREGHKMWVISSAVIKLLDFSSTIQSLAELGDALCSHVASGEQTERSRLAVESWQRREPPHAQVLRIRLGTESVLGRLDTSGVSLSQYLEVPDGETESPLLAAARMSEAVPFASRRRIFDALRATPLSSTTPLLEEMSAEALVVVPNYAQMAHEQGAELARWVRQKLGITPQQRVDVDEILSRLGVSVTSHSFGTDVIDAVGCWGRAHGPAVLVNTDGKHAQSRLGRRTTLAHELGHVVFDRTGSLPAAEVLGGNAPRYPEQRANAFAAEFLVPKSALVSRLRAAEDKHLEVRRLREDFDVSQEVAGWQILNSAAHGLLNEDALDLVKSWVRQGAWFSRY